MSNTYPAYAFIVCDKKLPKALFLIFEISKHQNHPRINRPAHHWHRSKCNHTRIKTITKTHIKMSWSNRNTIRTQRQVVARRDAHNRALRVPRRNIPHSYRAIEASGDYLTQKKLAKRACRQRTDAMNGCHILDCISSIVSVEIIRFCNANVGDTNVSLLCRSLGAMENTKYLMWGVNYEIVFKVDEIVKKVPVMPQS